MQKTTTLSVNSHSIINTPVISCESNLLLTKNPIILNKGPFQDHPIMQKIRTGIQVVLFCRIEYIIVYMTFPLVQSIKLIREPQAFSPITDNLSELEPLTVRSVLLFFANKSMYTEPRSPVKVNDELSN